MPNDLKFQEISHGTYQINDFIPFESEGEPSGSYRYGSSATTKIIEQTDTIPTELNTAFGISYQIDSESSEEYLIEKVWTFPTEIIDDEGKKFKQMKKSLKVKTNQHLYSFYLLEKEYEMVKGEWRLEFFFKGKKLYEKKFFIQ